MGNARETTDVFDPMEALVESSLALVFQTYDAAIKDRVAEPVVMLIDCEDEMGREIAEAWLGAEAVEDAVLAVEAEQEEADGEFTTVFARPMSLADCRREVPTVFPYLDRAFDRLPDEAVLVMVVTAGGAATFIVPYSSRE